MLPFTSTVFLKFRLYSWKVNLKINILLVATIVFRICVNNKNKKTPQMLYNSRNTLQDQFKPRLWLCSYQFFSFELWSEWNFDFELVEKVVWCSSVLLPHLSGRRTLYSDTVMKVRLTRCLRFPLLHGKLTLLYLTVQQYCVTVQTNVVIAAS